MVTIVCFVVVAFHRLMVAASTWLTFDVLNAILFDLIADADRLTAFGTVAAHRSPSKEGYAV